jgi:toxin ParE1/3/4
MDARDRQVFRSKEAAEDLLAIWQFGADEWSPEIADRHLRDIDATCDRLLDAPELGRSRDDLLPGIRSIVVRPHVVFYRLSPGSIYLIRVLHQRLDLEAEFRAPHAPY